MGLEQKRIALGNGIELDVVDEGPRDAPVLIFLHGGGWEFGYKEWMGYMARALKGVPEVAPVVPEGVVTVRINEAGQHVADGGRSEFFLRETLPPEASTTEASARTSEETRSQLF